jgi:hypothetical protein
MLEIGLQALRKSVVQAEVWCDDKAALEKLAANKERLFAQLTMSNMTGQLTDPNLHGAMAAYARGDYKIEERDGKYGLIFYGMPSAEIHKSVLTADRRMKIIKEGDAPACEICGQPAYAHTGISRKYFRVDEHGKPAIVHAGWCMRCLFSRQNEHQNPTKEEAIALASREMKA